ncbi:MAG TPA: hypothetical protein DCF33_19585 [Saprospirales bacterium]|nr:hypothetical protein [Saprospirales bacterium]
MKTLFAILISVLFNAPGFSQQDLLPAFPREIRGEGTTGNIAYFIPENKPFTGIAVDEKTNKKLGEYSNGYRNGMFTEYFPNGKKKCEGKYTNGVKDGTHTEWFVNGIKKNEIVFANGKQEGKYVLWYDNGTIEYEVNYTNGKKEGLEIYYFKNGKIKVTYKYSVGKIIIGSYILYNENGEKEKIEAYEYGSCNFCNGDGKQKCHSCSGKGKLPCQYCANGKTKCNNCYGKGSLQCNMCHAQGQVSTCPKCNGRGIISTNLGIGVLNSTCLNCNGSGRGNFICNNCNGNGRNSCASCTGQGTINCSYCRGFTFTNCQGCKGIGKSNSNCQGCNGTGKSSEIIMRVATENSELNATSSPKSTDDASIVDTTYQNGTRYIGHTHNGKHNGQGKIVYTDGSSYDGEWKDGKIDGYGTVMWANGKVYVGYLMNDQIHGKGITYNGQGNIECDCQYTNGKENGFGKFYDYSDGILKYQGEFKDANFHGHGEYYSKTKDGTLSVFTGEFRNGNFYNGTMTLTLSGGSQSQTEFINGVKGKTKKITK